MPSNILGVYDSNNKGTLFFVYCASDIIFFLLAPSLAPHFIVAYNTGSTSLVVEWSHLVEEQFQGQPIGYFIRYYPRLLGRKSEQFDRVNYQKNTTILTNLTVYTMYVIFVSAVSSGGMGPENMAEALTGTSGRR